jgi:hypothetical protein
LKEPNEESGIDAVTTPRPLRHDVLTARALKLNFFHSLAHLDLSSRLDPLYNISCPVCSPHHHITSFETHISRLHLGKSALILGSTGATGKHVLKEVLASPEYTRVGEFGRRVTSEKDLPADHAKLEQHTIDFDKLTAGGDEGLKAGKWDVVIIV